MRDVLRDELHRAAGERLDEIERDLKEGKLDEARAQELWDQLVQKLRIVPYKSSAESMVALAGGHLDVVSATTPNLLPYLQSGRVRVLAIAADKRLEGVFAQSPTWKEPNPLSSWRWSSELGNVCP